MPKYLNFFWFILLSALWGGSYVAIKEVVSLSPPLFDAFARVAIAWFTLFLIFRLLKINTRVEFNLRCRMWIIGLFALGFPFLFLFWAERYVSAGLAGILCATVPLWAFILSPLFVSTKGFFVWQKMLGLLLGFLGSIVIFWPMLHLTKHPLEIAGTIAAVLTSFSYAIGALLNQRLLAGKNISFQANIYHQLVASTVLLFIAACVLEPWPSTHLLLHSPIMWSTTLYLGVLSTALAWLLYYHLIREWGVVRAVTSTYLVPVMALVWDFVFFGNQPVWSEAVGVIIILFGVVLIQFAREPQSSLPKG